MGDPAAPRTDDDAGALAGTWEVLDPETEPAWGTPAHIGVRYSHAAVAHAGELVVSHGYFYNHKRREPTWESDTWRFEPERAAWRRVHGPWERGKPREMPSPRYSTSAVEYGDALLMFGGDDGGHLHSPTNYVFDAFFDELWVLSLRSHEWFLAPNPEGAPWPAKRALHGATLVNGRMHVYGGLGAAADDHWALCLESGGRSGASAADAATWRWLRVRATAAGPGPSAPGARHSVAIAAGGDGRGFYLYGGSRRAKDAPGARPRVYDDLWYFREAEGGEDLVAGELRGSWTRLGAGRDARALPPRPALPWPGARGHHSLVTLGEGSGADVGVLLFGGALCVPGCSCYNDTWVWEPERRRFRPVVVRARARSPCASFPSPMPLSGRASARAALPLT